MLKPAQFYHNEGLCVIPVEPGDKRPALATWEEYHTRCSTAAEVEQWFGNGKAYNIGIVHGEVSGNFVSIDIDKDSGAFDLLRNRFPILVAGRVEQSGSGQGYHIPLRVDTLPDFGTDNRQARPRGNKTWKTESGDINLRCRFCQTVVPPSLHPSGNRYRFLQKGAITQLPNLEPIIEWLDQQAPPKGKELSTRSKPAGSWMPTGQGETLIEAVKDYWSTTLLVFDYFGMATNVVDDRDEWRLLGNGGLLVPIDNPEVFYNFSDEIGGGVFEAWGWQRFGSSYDKHRHFRQVLVEMAQVAGIDVAKYYQRGDEKRLAPVQTDQGGDKQYWTKKYQVWGQMR
jgi:hypothetical protein